MYTGFFFKLWDSAVGTVSKAPCVCSRCEVAKGNRSAEKWAKLEKPDYAPLLRPSFWAKGLFGKRDE
jgi:hypothetical protein